MSIFADFARVQSYAPRIEGLDGVVSDRCRAALSKGEVPPAPLGEEARTLRLHAGHGSFSHAPVVRWCPISGWRDAVPVRLRLLRHVAGMVPHIGLWTDDRGGVRVDAISAAQYCARLDGIELDLALESIAYAIRDHDDPEAERSMRVVLEWAIPVWRAEAIAAA